MHKKHREHKKVEKRRDCVVVVVWNACVKKEVECSSLNG
jgi:hypothetical protein